MIGRHPDPRLAPEQQTLAWQSASLLLDYPDDGLRDRTALIRSAAGRLPPPVGAPLAAFVDHVERTSPVELAADYVRTFDHQRRCCLFLSYFSSGDTRKRGVALLRFKQTYLRSGLLLADDELPDHLAVVLEYAALTDQRLGWKLLLDYRAGLELLRLALRELESPWALVLESVHATLPPLRGDERDQVMRLAQEGPPEEEVGLEPFAPPEYMPAGTSSAVGGGRR